MPQKIQSEVQKIIAEFIWERFIVIVAMNNLSKDIADGGRKVIDIEPRNVSIDPNVDKRLPEDGTRTTGMSSVDGQDFQNGKSQKCERNP